jgi:hypothetical protein
MTWLTIINTIISWLWLIAVLALLWLIWRSSEARLKHVQKMEITLVDVAMKDAETARKAVETNQLLAAECGIGPERTEMTPADILPVLSILLTLFALAGGYVAFRNGKNQQSSVIQEQTINALLARVETLEKQVEEAQQKLAKEQQLLATIRLALKRRGLHIEIGDGLVTLIDANNQSSSMQIPPVSRVQKPKPVKLQPIEPDEDDDDTIS